MAEIDDCLLHDLTSQIHQIPLSYIGLEKLVVDHTVYVLQIFLVSHKFYTTTKYYEVMHPRHTVQNN